MLENSLGPDIIGSLTGYLSESGKRILPPDLIEKAKHHILDTLAAIISGSSLKPGLLAKEFVAGQGGVEEALVVGSSLITSAINAAFANGMMGHAGETDDFEPASLTHPGVAVIPAALAVAEREKADGMRFLKGIVAGYDICCRITRALGRDDLDKANLSTHSLGSFFGAASAAASIMGLTTDQIRYVISYTVQQVSGTTNWLRDQEHIEKAFVYGGMPARDGVAATLLVQSGFTGVWDPFSGDPNYFTSSILPHAQPQLLVEDLGTRYDIMATTLKRYPVGGPIQAALDGLYILMERHGITRDNVEKIRARLPSNTGFVVSNREMPNINLQYVFAVALLEGRLSFKASLSHERMKDPDVMEMKKRIDLVLDDGLVDPAVPRQAIVEGTLKDGSHFSEHVKWVRGFAENPMNREDVEEKSRELVEPILGPERSSGLIDRIWSIEGISDVRGLRPFLWA